MQMKMPLPLRTCEEKKEKGKGKLDKAENFCLIRSNFEGVRSKVFFVCEPSKEWALKSYLLFFFQN